MKTGSSQDTNRKREHWFLYKLQSKGGDKTLGEDCLIWQVVVMCVRAETEDIRKGLSFGIRPPAR